MKNDQSFQAFMVRIYKRYLWLY